MNNSFVEREIGKVPKKASFYDNAKIVITILALVGLFIGIILNYIEVLGTEKSQGITYEFLSNMTYDASELPNLIPFHQYTFFDKSEIEDRIKCKIDN